MNFKVLSLALILVLPLFILGCDDNNGNDATALTENDFVEDAALSANPEKDVMVTFLEDPTSEVPENDTGGVGVDEIPITYPETVEQTFCWEDDDQDAQHFMELRDNEGSLVLTVEANGDCVTEVIEPGDYVMFIHNDGRMEDTQAIFIIPDLNNTEEARKTDGLFNGFKGTVANILQGLPSALYEDARAQTVQENIDTLIKTKNCEDCNLRKANLKGARLVGVILDGADLRRADLTGNANLTDAKLTLAKLNGADLTGASLLRARLVSANLSEAILTFAVLRNADLRSAKLNNAKLSGAQLSGAKWCDACTCALGSVGKCDGCASQDTCKGP